MDNRGEVSQILIGTIFMTREKATCKNYIQIAFLRIKNYCSYQKLCHFKVLKICDTSPRYFLGKGPKF